MRIVLLIVGILAFLMGVHWIGQGTGMFTWPSGQSATMYMVAQWTYIGIATAIVGAGLIWWSRR